MKRIGLLALLLLSVGAKGQFNCQSTKHAPASMQMTAPIDYNSRSDTADLAELDLYINTTDFANKQLTGVARYQIGCEINFNSLRFDLIGYTVDSVVSPTGPLNFTQTANHVTVHQSAYAGAILHWTFYYHGTTTKDASGWGGIHHDGAYQYNLGVGFAANPHVYGRSLFPCFDNFREKCTVEEMHITTLPGKVGVSNGIFDRVDTLSNGNLTWVWKGNAPLRSYLVSLAVSDYHKQSWTHAGETFELYGRAQDTANMTAGFVHLNDIYDAFVEEFGPYVFEKVGYAMTITGAMEHAGMIHLPRTLANANLSGEDIIAHELAHMWFGNAVTTETAEDMWINEGFAEFGSHFYEEKVYGRPQYVNTVQNNQALVLKQAAQSDGGHLALSGVNQNQTYGTHTYQKGAMVAHNLREFLGDSLFSHAVKQLIATNTFGNYNANTFKESFENSTGVDLDDFWNDWIYNPGYHGVHAELTYGNNVNWASNQKSVRLHHLSAHLPSTYGPSQNTTPVNIYKHSYNNGYLGKVNLGTSENFPATSTNGTYYTGQVDLGAGSDYWISVNDSAESLGTSVYDSFKWSDLNGTTTLPRTGVKITPSSSNNGLHGTFYVWHHIVEGMHPDGIITSKDHVYFIGYEGAHDPPVSLNTALPFEVTLQYNTNASNGGLDSDLSGQPGNKMTVGESPFMSWMTGSVMSNVNNQTLGNFGIGNLTFTPQHLARYYFIMNSSNIGMEEQKEDGLKLYPNPSEGRLKIETNLGSTQLQYEISDMSGKLVDHGSLDHTNGTSELSLAQEMSKGTYLFTCEAGSARFSLR